jgi:hypothetical protein
LTEAARSTVLGFAAAALLSVLPAPLAAQRLHDCRGYPSQRVIREIKVPVETIRRVEREAADRLVGLDTRPYDWLLDQARTARSEIAVPALLQAEESLKRCRNYIRPVRASCAAAASALVRVIEEIIAGEDKKDKDDKEDKKDKDGKNETGNEARKAFAEVMPHCERAVSLPPLDTTLRKFE